MVTSIETLRTVEVLPARREAGSEGCVEHSAGGRHGFGEKSRRTCPTAA